VAILAQVFPKLIDNPVNEYPARPTWLAHLVSPPGWNPVAYRKGNGNLSCKHLPFFVKELVMRINSSPLNFPMFLVAAASILGALYTSTPAHARDLVGNPIVSNSQDAGGKAKKALIDGKSTRLVKSQATNVNEAVASSMLTAQGEGTDAARKAEFARRLFWVMLSMR
jgi:hypothetical protein